MHDRSCDVSSPVKRSTERSSRRPRLRSSSILWPGDKDEGTRPASEHAADPDDVVRGLTRGFGLAVADGGVCCGPMRIRVVAGEPAGIESVDVAVRSIAGARDALRARGASFREEKDRLGVAPGEACGCRLVFVARP